MEKHFGLLLILLLVLKHIDSMLLPSFDWNTRNPLFHGKKCGGDYAHISLDFGSEMYFVCPSVVINHEAGRKRNKATMFENMFLVSKDAFDKCEVNKDAIQILSCNKAYDLGSIVFNQIYFSDWTMMSPYSQGKTYYFINTATGLEKDVNQTSGGRCKTARMKLAVTICFSRQNCNTRKHLCHTPLVIPTTRKTTITTVTPLAPLTPAGAALMNPSQQPNNGSSYFSTTAIICIAICLIGGIIIGFGLHYAVVKHKGKKNNTEPPEKPLPTASIALDNNESDSSTLRRTMNERYFSSEDPTYGNSTEFKRLLSTSSASSTERHSAVPIGQYSQ